MTTVDRPEVTVLMPVRDAARFVGAAIDSLLAQTVHALEVIVVDDGSVDGSLDIVRARADRRISILEPGGGVGVARALNIGLGAARAPVVARQDADDVAHPRRLERQLAVLRERRDLAIVGARGYTADASGRRVGAVDRPLHADGVRWFVCFDNPFVHTSVAFRRDIVSALGGYDETLPWAQDWELWSRVLRAHDGMNVADRLVTYRSHEHSVTASRDPARHRALAQGLVTKNVEAVCGLRLRDDEAALLAAYGTELAASDIAPFFVLVRQLLSAFAGRYPSAATGGEPARTLAWQIDALAARVLPRSRASALAVYRAGLAAVPAARQWISWPRAAARVCLGPRGLAHVRRWRRAPGLGWPSA